MTRTTVILALVLILYPLASSGHEINQRFEEISGQYAECAAYYDLVYHAMKSSNEKETVDAYFQHYKNASAYSLMLANQGRSRSMTVNVTNSRIEMYIKKMRQETNNRNENISILINKYHFGCEEAMKNPPSKVFAGVPIQKISEAGIERYTETVQKEQAVNLGCVIIEVGGKFYWVTRANKEMIRLPGGAFVTYLAQDGSGYVRVIDPSAKEAAALMSPTIQRSTMLNICSWDLGVSLTTALFSSSMTSNPSLVRTWPSMSVQASYAKRHI